MSKMNILIDENIPFIKGVFEEYANVSYKKGRDICREDLKDVEVLIVRTRTHCDENLLKDTAVKLIATATIGEDHIDLEYCEKNGIVVRTSAGCNSFAVMNYVFSALYGFASRKAIDLSGKTIGIIGLGNVGSKVNNVATILGFKVKRYDPPKAALEGDYGFCSLDELLDESDIVSLHTPLNAETKHMVNAEFLSKMKEGSILINTARGEIVDEQALIDARAKLSGIIIDTWNNEPNINEELLDIVDIATPHVAGYSYKGKQNATIWTVKQVARFLGFEALYDFFPATFNHALESQKLDLRNKNQGEIAALLQYNYPIFIDDTKLRLDISSFETLRSEYQYRREFYID